MELSNVDDSFDETNDVHSGRHGLTQTEEDTNGSTKFRP
jgi:hypothetical protein